MFKDYILLHLRRIKGSDLEHLTLLLPIVCVSVQTPHFKQQNSVGLGWKERYAGKNTCPLWAETLRCCFRVDWDTPKFLPKMRCICVCAYVNLPV